MKRTALFASRFCLAVAHAGAAELRVGLSAETTSLFPNWFVTTGNQAVSRLPRKLLICGLRFSPTANVIRGRWWRCTGP